MQASPQGYERNDDERQDTFNQKVGLAQVSYLFWSSSWRYPHVLLVFLQEDEGNNDGWETVQKKPTKRHQKVIISQLSELVLLSKTQTRSRCLSTIQALVSCYWLKDAEENCISIYRPKRPRELKFILLSDELNQMKETDRATCHFFKLFGCAFFGSFLFLKIISS